MISIRKSIELTGGTAPYTYQWNSDDGSVSFSEVSGISNTGIVNTDIIYPLEATIATATITVQGFDAEGCPINVTVTVDNPCDNFTITNLTVTDQTDFSLNGEARKAFSITGNSDDCTTVEFEWLYDDNLLDNLGDIGSGNRSTISFRLNSNARSYPANIPVKVNVTDCNNCLKTATGNYEVETGYAQDMIADLAYNSVTGQYESGNLQIPGLLSSSNLLPIYSTLEFVLPSGITYEVTDVENGKVKFTAPATTDGGLHVGTYTYKLNNGVWAYDGSIKFNVIAIERCKDLVTGDKTITMTSSEVAGDTKIIPISDEIVISAGETIDWDTWQVVTPPSSNSPSITLTTSVTGEKSIAYVIPTPKADDSFAWTVATENGKWMCTAIYTMINGTNAPVAVDDASDVQCTTPVIIDVLGNDTSTGSQLDPSTITIVTAPSYGTVSNPLDGTLIYTCTNPFQTSDTFTYKVANTSGDFSNNATVTLTIACSGSNASVSLCN